MGQKDFRTIFTLGYRSIDFQTEDEDVKNQLERADYYYLQKGIYLPGIISSETRIRT